MVLNGNSPKKQSREENTDTANVETTQENDSKNTPETLENDRPGHVVDSRRANEKLHDAQSRSLNARNRASTKQKLPTNQKSSAFMPVPDEIIDVTEGYLQKFLLQTLGMSSSKVFDAIAKGGKLIKFDKKDSILRKGDLNEYLYVVNEGVVNILTSDSCVTIATMCKGDIFGEVSVIFGVPCTANVTAHTDVTVVCLEKTDAIAIFEDRLQNMDILNWFVKRRYLPTDDVLDDSRFYRRIAFRILREVFLFEDWSDNQIKSLIMLIDHSLVLLYPRQAKLLIEGDPLDSLLVVIDGTVEITSGPTRVRTIEISKGDKPFVFGETGVQFENQISAVTIKAVNNCKVICIERDWIMQILHRHSDIDDKFQDRCVDLRGLMASFGYLYKKYKMYLQLDLIYYSVSSADFYSKRKFSGNIIHKKITNGVVQEFDKGADILPAMEHDMYESVLVLCGILFAKHMIKDYSKSLESTGEELANKRVIKTGTHVKVVEEDAIYTVNHMVDGDNETSKKRSSITSTDMIIPEGQVIDTSKYCKPGVSLLAYTHCLVLKIRNEDNVADLQSKKETAIDESVWNATPQKVDTSLEFV